MTKFITRVVLHKAVDKDYEILHKEMEEEGFSRTIVSGEGVEYHLPEAEYYISNNYSADMIRTMAIDAASKTKKEYAVLITPCSTDIYWQGLDKVNDKH